MLHVFQAATADELWRNLAHEFAARSDREFTMGRGGRTLELLHVGFSIAKPHERWVPSRTPPLNVAFALAEVLVHAGERVGVPGLVRPTGSRNVLDKIANAIVHDPTERPSLPRAFAPSSLSEIVLISDFWSPIDDIRKTIAQLSSSGAHGHTVQIVDPAEETFPYSGRVEFVEPEGGESITAGRAEAWRAEYEALVARHRAQIRADTDKIGWSFAIHRTDRAATELLLALHARMSAPPPGAIVGGRVATAGQRRHA